MDASWKCPANKEKWKSPVVEPTCNERYSKNQRKLQFSLLRSSWFFLPSIKIAQLVSDIKQHHMTNTYHNDYGCWRFSVQSIDNDSFICSIANQFVYTPDTPLQIHGKGGQVVNYVLQNLLYYIHCVMCVVILPVVWFTKSSQWHKNRTCVLLVRVKYFWDILMKQVVGWYI